MCGWLCFYLQPLEDCWDWSRLFQSIGCWSVFSLSQLDSAQKLLYFFCDWIPQMQLNTHQLGKSRKRGKTRFTIIQRVHQTIKCIKLRRNLINWKWIYPKAKNLKMASSKDIALKVKLILSANCTSGYENHYVRISLSASLKWV